MSSETERLMRTMLAEVDAELRAEIAEAGQWTLGRFIDALNAAPPDHCIRFRFASAGVGDFNSYRGYYDHLAIEPTVSGSLVKDVLERAAACMGHTFTGYKGGNYVMHAGTPLWVAYYGSSGGSRVVGVTVDKYETIVETVDQDA